MGIFVNPGNSAFQVALNSEIYVDKTGLLSYTNKVIDTTNALICNSRPRRFGKSITANMLTAYYSTGCDSAAMFEGGFAGLVFLPRKEYPELPALLVELKWNQSVNAAISQIKDRKYMAALEQHTGEILLVEVNLITRPRPIPIPTA